MLPTADEQKVEIAGVEYVATDGRSAWQKVWRRRRAAKGLPAQQLDFQRWARRATDDATSNDNVA